MDEGRSGSFPDTEAPTGKPIRCNGRSALSIEAERQLLREIELSGGLFTASIKAICDRNPKEFGGPSTSMRKAVRNKVTKWRNLSPEAYQLLVRDLGHNDDTLHSPHSSLVHSTPPPRNADDELVSFYPTTRSRMLRSPGGILPLSSPPPRNRFQIPMPADGASEDEFYIHDVLNDESRYVQVEVDVDHPERNGETSIFFFTDKNNDGKLHNGFSMQMSVDPRDAFAGAYKAFLIPDYPYIFIKAPGQTATFRSDHGAFTAKEGTKLCPRVQEAMDLNRNAVITDGKRSIMHLLLKFPVLMHLSNAIYSPDAVSGSIKPKITLVQIKTAIGVNPMAMKQIAMMMCRIEWKVDIIEKTPRLVKEAKPRGKSHQEEMLEQLEGMDLNDH